MPKNIGIDTVSFSGHKEYPVYLIEKDLTCHRFNSVSEAADYLGVEVTLVQKYLNTSIRKILNGYVCTRANAIETENQDKTEINKAKLYASMFSSDFGLTSVPVYMVMPNGEYEKFNSIEEVAQIINKPADLIYKKIKNGFSIINGVALVSAIHFEDESTNDKIDIFAHQEIMDEFNQTKKDSICAIYPDGSYAIYNNIQEASNATKVKYAMISSIISKYDDRCATSNKITFERLENLAKRDKDGNFILDKNGILQIDERMIAKTREVFLNTKNAPAVLIFPDYSYKIYNEVKTLKQENEVTTAHLTLMTNCAKSFDGYTVAWLRDVVLRDENGILIFDENGNYLVDEAKIKQRHKLAKLDRYEN